MVLLKSLVDWSQVFYLQGRDNHSYAGLARRAKGWMTTLVVPMPGAVSNLIMQDYCGLKSERLLACL